jgi:hypothetical protein
VVHITTRGFVSYGFKITTTTGAVAAVALPQATAQLAGVVAAATKQASTFFLKLWWQGAQVAPGGTPSGPTAGTTPASLTIPVPVAGIAFSLPSPVNNGGPLWYWISANAVDSDTTALTTAGDVINLILQ